MPAEAEWAVGLGPGARATTSYPWIATEAACDTVTVSYKRGHGGEAVQPVPRGLAGSLRSCFPWPLTDADACYRFLIFHKHKLAERLYASPRTLLQPPKLILFHRRGTAASLSTTLFPFSSSICIYTRTQQLSSSSLARPETPLSNPDPTRQNGDLQPSCPRLCPKRRLQTSVILQKRKRDPPSLENPLARPFGSGIVEPKNPRTLSAWPAGGGVCLGFVQSRKLQDTPCSACSNTGLAYDTQLPHSFNS